MKRNQFVIAILMLVGAFTSAALFSSCSESKGDDVDEYADWQAKNDAYFNKVYTEAEQAVKSGSKEWMAQRDIVDHDVLHPSLIHLLKG